MAGEEEEGSAMPAAHFRAWLAHMALSERQAVAVLGISRMTIRRYLRDGAPVHVGLACAALARGITPWRPR